MSKSSIKKALLGKIILVLFMCMILSGCSASGSGVKEKGGLYEKNPVDVCEHYINNLANKKRNQYVFSDMNNGQKVYDEYSGYFEDSYFKLSDLVDENKVYSDIEGLDARIKDTKMMYVKPSAHINMLTNPLKIKSEDGKVKEYKNPIALDVYFKLAYKDKNKVLAYDDGENMMTFYLVQDEWGNYKILSIGK